MKNNTGRNRKENETSEKNYRKRINEIFDIPYSAMSGTAKIEISDNNEAVIDGCSGILEYSDNIVKLSAGKMAIKFFGRGLEIKALTKDSAVVSGFIMNIEFIV